jgi:hypothetical protein
VINNIVIILSHFYPPKSHYFLFSISVEFHQETKKEKEKKELHLRINYSLEKQSSLSSGSSSTQIGEVIEKNSIWGKRKRAKKPRTLKLCNGFFMFCISLLGGKNLTSKAILSLML